MIDYRLNNVTTDKKISLFFTVIVFIIVLIINGIVFYTTEQQWEYNKKFYADKILSDIHNKKDAEQLENVRVFDERSSIIFNTGIFASFPTQQQIEHNSIVRFNNNSYFISLAKTADGGSICYAQNVTDFISIRNSIIENTLIFSLLTLVFIYIIGIYFSRYMLRPIREINEHTKNYSLRSEISMIPWIGNAHDDIGVLTHTMNSLFTNLREEAQKIEQFSSDVSHEFKNGLAELKTHIQIMLAKQMYSKDCLVKMNTTIDSMGSLIESLILLARLDQITFAMENVFVKETLLNCKEIQNPKVIFHGDDSTAHIQVPLFSLAIGNIISNAIKFTQGSGKIWVNIKNNILTIHDNGIGIQPENIEKIWDRFYKESEDRAYGSGYGIGLSLTKKILDIHGFSITVESQLQKGTKFVIHLK